MKLLVIGNGFDLAIGAKTSYSNYFESEYYSDTKNKVIKWESHFRNREMSGAAPSNMLDYNFTCWDLLLHLVSSQPTTDQKDRKSLRWCDIEEVIHKSLSQETEDYFSWNRVFKLLKYAKTDNYSYNAQPVIKDQERTMKYFLNTGWKDLNSSAFFGKLLDELNNFEKVFGKYIYEESNKEIFRSNARSLARYLYESKHSVYVDSFNYSDFSEEHHIVIRHINSDCENPIFGVTYGNEKQPVSDIKQRFTKTSRRLHQEALSINVDPSKNWDGVDKAVVFGHSLNMMDFDYFNYLFTLLKFHTFDVPQMGSIEFVYYVYKESDRDSIQRKRVDEVYNMLNAYERHVSNGNQQVLINLLRFSGKLRIRELTKDELYKVIGCS